MFTKIEVHFLSNGSPRRAVVFPGKGVQAIFLEGAEVEFVPGIPARKRIPPPEAVAVEGQLRPMSANIEEGPGGVCYLFGGQLHCW